jgi:hypothetical protein
MTNHSGDGRSALLVRALRYASSGERRLGCAFVCVCVCVCEEQTVWGSCILMDTRTGKFDTQMYLLR